MRNKSAFSIKRRTATAALARVVVARVGETPRARVRVRALIANCIMPCRMQIYLSPAAKRNCPRPDGARRRRALNARARARARNCNRARECALGRTRASPCAPRDCVIFPAILPCPLLLFLLAIAVATYENLSLFCRLLPSRARREITIRVRGEHPFPLSRVRFG